MAKDWIIEWLIKKGSSVEFLKKNVGNNYLEYGIVDSLVFLELISAIENEFKFNFDDNDFEKDEIFTIDGLSSIVESKRK